MRINSPSSLALLGLLSLTLSGCIATEKLDYQLMQNEEAKWVADEPLTDTIIAVGRPSKALPGYENAIVFAGEKQSYLVETPSKNDELKVILQQVDLAYFSFKPMPTVEAPHFKVRVGEKDCLSPQGCLATLLWFEKPNALLAAGESQKLENFGFTCHQFPNDMMRCTKSLWHLPLTVAAPVSNIESLPYRFKQPIPLKFYHYDENKGTADRKKIKALMPLAKAFDIITFPIQFLIIEAIS